jgi:hypothetical protein
MKIWRIESLTTWSSWDNYILLLAKKVLFIIDSNILEPITIHFIVNQKFTNYIKFFCWQDRLGYPVSIIMWRIFFFYEYVLKSQKILQSNNLFVMSSQRKLKFDELNMSQFENMDHLDTLWLEMDASTKLVTCMFTHN